MFGQFPPLDHRRRTRAALLSAKSIDSRQPPLLPCRRVHPLQHPFSSFLSAASSPGGHRGLSAAIYPFLLPRPPSSSLLCDELESSHHRHFQPPRDATMRQRASPRPPDYTRKPHPPGLLQRDQKREPGVPRHCLKMWGSFSARGNRRSLN